MCVFLFVCFFSRGGRSHWIGQQLPPGAQSVTVKHVCVILGQMTDKQKGSLKTTYSFNRIGNGSDQL